MLRRIKRKRPNAVDIERAQHAEREASVAAERAQQALAHPVASASAGATAPPSHLTRQRASRVLPPRNHGPETRPFSRAAVHGL